MPGARLVEAERPASAINHVTDGSFTAKRVEGRELLDAAKLYEVEVAGVPAAKNVPAPAAGTTITVTTSPDEVLTNNNDFIAGEGQREEDSE